MPAPRPLLRRRDTKAADIDSLVGLGLAQPPPEPAPPPEPTPSPEQQANEALLEEALTDAGIDTTGEDEGVVDALAGLPPDQVATVARWLKTKKSKDETR